MDEKQLVAILAAILSLRKDAPTLPGAFEEAKKLWTLVNTGKLPKG
jgi:hypothetical protein